MAIDSTWGGSDSNSYIDLATADSFITEAVVDPAAWTVATTTQQSAALREATRDIDSQEYLGCRYYEDQMLQFPREFVNGWPWNRVTSGGSTVYSIEQHRMQVAVEQATCYQAVSILRRGGLD